jgi:imidazolonepropionase-like amidohydrolase
MFFVLSFVPLVIAAAIAQQSATSGPGHPDPLPESSPVQIKQGTTPRSGDICIVHVTVIDTASGKENRDSVVTISGDRIAGIAAGSAMAPAGSCTVIDGTGKYLIPGLWDMHAHGSQFDGVLPLYVANGVSGIREMFGPPDANQFRRELAARHSIAPHIYLGSHLVDGDPRMNAKEKYGSVTPGKLADLVLLDADPLADIRNTSKISEVFLAGEEFDRVRLDRLISIARDAPSQKSY